MRKTILVTGSTDGIGLEAARRLVADGHHVLMHGRSQTKLDAAVASVLDAAPEGAVEGYLADLSRMSDVESLASNVAERYESIDVLINNAGVLRAPDALTPEGHDVRMVVNMVAPYVLTTRLLPIIAPTGRIINLSSAAQRTVDLASFDTGAALESLEAYAQSKLAITMWSRHLAAELGASGPIVVAVNPGSMLATNMVKEGFGVAGNDIGIGADILVRAATSDEFSDASGRYFDNDARAFGPPHLDALDAALADALEARLERFTAELAPA